MMKLLFYLGHPAHFHLFKNVIKAAAKRNHEISILIKKKDVLEDLLTKENVDYINILPKGRRANKLSIGMGLLKRDFRTLIFCKKNRPDLMIGTSAEITHVGRLLNIHSIVVNEDDAEQVPYFANLAYPFADGILVPVSCSTAKWGYKTIYYNGYHELAYLHPGYYNPTAERIRELTNGQKNKYFILRFAKLTSHHDAGKTGIKPEIAEKIIVMLRPYGNVFISSERKLESQFAKYLIPINPVEMHNALYYCHLFIGDSQTMAAEAAVLGTPSIRFNDFVGKLGYLEELEHRYGLTYGITTSEPEKLFNKIEELLSIRSLKEEWDLRRQKMLGDKIDVTAFMSWLFENYPKSIEILRKNPEYENNFKHLQVSEYCVE